MSVSDKAPEVEFASVVVEKRWKVTSFYKQEYISILVVINKSILIV